MLAAEHDQVCWAPRRPLTKESTTAMSPRQQYHVAPIGVVSSELADPADAPPQGDEGAPGAVLIMDDEVLAAMADLGAGDRLVVLTWLHAARRDVLSVHPRGEESRPLTGVFSTRSPDRPNPIGLHPVTVLAVDANRIQVSGIEAIDGTPILDIKPALGPVEAR